MPRPCIGRRDSEPHLAFLDSRGGPPSSPPRPLRGFPAGPQTDQQGGLCWHENRFVRPLARACAQTLAAAALAAGTAQAQEAGQLEEITVTAQRRLENVQEVPLSVSPLSGERMDALFEGGDDIRALATRIPSLYAESSNGRLSPRFYIRGLGNTDFDLAASQPVSVLVDEVVLENVILKSFPLFDIERVEVLRGPQGTLFGRNTPAGVVKFDTKKPTPGFRRRPRARYGELERPTSRARSAAACERRFGAGIAVLYQSRGDWISNDFTGESDAMGGFDELAYRGQLLLEPTERSARCSTCTAATTTAPHRSSAPTCSARAATASTRTTTATPSASTKATTIRRRRRPRRLPQDRLRLRRRHDADLDHRVRADRDQQPRRHRRRIRRRFPPLRVGPCPPGSTPGASLHPVPFADARTGSTTSTSSRRSSASPRRRASSCSGRRVSSTSIPSSR